MENVTQFDVLVVYTGEIAISASSTKKGTDSPFAIHTKRSHYNNAYAYLLQMCEKNNLSCALTTSADMTPEGNFTSYWVFRKKKWLKINKTCYCRLIFDKFSPINKNQKELRNILFSDTNVKSFNSSVLFQLFFDKQKTYEHLQRFTIPTVVIENENQHSIDQAVDNLKKLVAIHPASNDFSQKFVLKDRFGAGGDNIYLVNTHNPKKEIFGIVKENKSTTFILQPFTKFESGYSYKDQRGFIDIRIIYLGKKAIQAYIRTAKKDDFRCNEHQGGTLTYISQKELPVKVLGVSNQIVNILDENSALYALDFIVSNNGNVYLLEGNCGPGIDWNLSLKKNEFMAKKLIRNIAAELARRVENTASDIPKTSLPVLEIDVEKILPLLLCATAQTI